MSETEVRTGSLLQRGRESLEQGVRLAFTEIPEACRNPDTPEKKIVCRSVRYWQLQFKKNGLPWSDEIIYQVLSEGLVETYRTMLKAQRFLELLQETDPLSVIKNLRKKGGSDRLDTLSDQELDAFAQVGRLLSELSNYMSKNTAVPYRIDFSTYTLLPLWLDGEFQKSAQNLLRLKQLAASNVEALRHDFPHKLSLQIFHELQPTETTTSTEGTGTRGGWRYRLSLDDEYKSVITTIRERFTGFNQEQIESTRTQYLSTLDIDIAYTDALGMAFSTFLQGLSVKMTVNNQAFVFRPQKQLITDLQDSWWDWLFG